MINVCQVIIIIQSLLIWASTKVPSPIFKVVELLTYFQLACRFSNVAYRLSHLCFLHLMFVLHNVTNNQQHLRILTHEPMSFFMKKQHLKMILLRTIFSDKVFKNDLPQIFFMQKKF
jgi:hypothetical protein